MPEFLPFNAVACHPEATSLVSLDWAEGYMAIRPQGSTDWDALGDANDYQNKKNALMRATMSISAMAYRSRGEKFYNKQRLPFPTDLDQGLYVNFIGENVEADEPTLTTTIIVEDLIDQPYARAGILVGGSLAFTQDEDSQEYGEFYRITEFDYATGTITVDGFIFDDVLVQAYQDSEGFHARITPSVPEDIKQAVVETAAYQLSTSGQQAMNMVQGVVEQALGSAKVRFSEPSSSSGDAMGRSIPTIAQDILKRYERTSAPMIANDLFI